MESERGGVAADGAAESTGVIRCAPFGNPLAFIIFLKKKNIPPLNNINPPNNQISDPRVRFWDTDFRAPEGGHLFGRYLQCKTKENGLKIEGGH